MQAGVSPRRYAGGEPATIYHYDEQGRLTHTQPEPEWDEWDQALVDELALWQTGIHQACGHHETALADPDVIPVAGYSVCKACQALQAAQQQQARTDKPAREAGKNPDYPRRWSIYLRSRTQAEEEAARRAEQKSPMQVMQEKLAELDQAGPTV